MNLTFANKVTIGRILTIPFFIVTILYYTPEKEYQRYLALGIFFIAVITDAVDGYIARTHRQKTKAGAILDPLADKLLLISAFLSLYKVGHLLGGITFPLWFVLAVISRDIILLIGSMIIYIIKRRLEVSPTQWGKATTCFQIFCIFGVLLQWNFSPLLWYAAATLTIISGLGYIRSGIKVLNVAFDQTHF